MCIYDVQSQRVFWANEQVQMSSVVVHVMSISVGGRSPGRSERKQLLVAARPGKAALLISLYAGAGRVIK